MLYIIEYKIVDINRTDEYPQEIKPREDILKEIDNVRNVHKYESHCCYNLDGSIDLKFTKETEYFGTSTIIGKARKIAAGDKWPISHFDKQTIEYATIKQIIGDTVACQREDGTTFSFKQSTIMYHK